MSFIALFFSRRPRFCQNRRQPSAWTESSPLLALLTALNATAADTLSRPEWQKHFDAKGVRHVRCSSRERPLPRVQRSAPSSASFASTFKIPNALIGLEVGSIADEKEVFDGTASRRCAEWEHDQTLATGMRDSVV